MGRLIVVDGLDGCGKATQTKLLVELLAEKGVSARRLEFPCYDSDSSVLVRQYLNGTFGQKPDDVNCYAASMFYAADRFASFKTDWQNEYEHGGVFIADRYTTSNAVYQMAKLEQSQWVGFCDWLWDFEYTKLAIPRPDEVIYLDMSPSVSKNLLLQRYSGDESKKDIHERDMDFQLRCRQAALWCADSFNWNIITCDKDGMVRPVEEITHDILEKIELF